MISFRHKGDFGKTFAFLKRDRSAELRRIIHMYAAEGVRALMSVTPVDSHKTASAWGYEITEKKGYMTVSWTNSNVVDGVPIAILLQYGHGTGTGGYVQGRDYINPAIRPIFDKISNSIREAMIS